MPLKIDTYRNGVGGNSLYKALSHPLAGELAHALLNSLKKNEPVAIFDPDGIIEAFQAFFSLEQLHISGLFVQKVEHLGKSLRNHSAQPVTDLAGMNPGCVLVASFEPRKPLRDIELYLAADTPRFSFESLKLPEPLQTYPNQYLSALNFATNFAFFRDRETQHTRLTTSAYWTRYGAQRMRLWCRLFDLSGQTLATWQEDLSSSEGVIVVDSRDIRRRFGLPEFVGQLFMHVIGASGHDVVKYALDTFDDSGEVSITHDTNAWPADAYGGLPAPAAGEEVVVLIQNSHPTPIPANEIGLSVVGEGPICYLPYAIAPFATRSLNVRELAPLAKWPQQLVVHAGQYFVRPRYEIFDQGDHSRIAHVNIRRTDLEADPTLRRIHNVLGKMHILPASVLPPCLYKTDILPTPMTTAQANLPIKLVVYNKEGDAVAAHKFGSLGYKDLGSFSVSSLAEDGLGSEYGHVELTYDFEAGHDVDGWLHALFRYEHRQSGLKSETSFGAHVFNTVMTYRGEPQSYSGTAPGLSTRLFLRIASPDFETMCHLIYPVSRRWREFSSTDLILRDSRGTEVARKTVRIPSSGSLLWRVREMFDHNTLTAAGDNSYIIVRDETCRLFGYHGVFGPAGSFGFDHMFGF